MYDARSALQIFTSILFLTKYKKKCFQRKRDLKFKETNLGNLSYEYEFDTRLNDKF
jgi:hypothetical protein